MLYVVEIRRGRAELSTIMGRIREWLDDHRFEPDAFRCTTDEVSATFRLEFKFEREAKACAEVFGGEIRPMGDRHPE